MNNDSRRGFRAEYFVGAGMELIGFVLIFISNVNLHGSTTSSIKAAFSKIFSAPMNATSDPSLAFYGTLSLVGKSLKDLGWVFLALTFLFHLMTTAARMSASARRSPEADAPAAGTGS